MVVKALDGAHYVAAVDQEWRERTSVWGDSECRLYRALPSFRFVRKGGWLARTACTTQKAT